MSNYNQLAICTQLAPTNTITHSRQPQGIILSIPFTQGQLQNASTSKGNSIVYFTGRI